MQIIRLPRELPGELDLAELNQQLRACAVQLDWSEVEPPVAPEMLSVLLADLNLTEHLDALGAETVADALAPTLIALLAPTPLEPFDAEETISVKAVSGTTPGLWTPPAETEEEQNDAVNGAPPLARTRSHCYKRPRPLPCAMNWRSWLSAICSARLVVKRKK